MGMKGYKWSMSEKETLKENYQKCVHKKISKKDLLLLLPGRTWNGIIGMARTLKLYKKLPLGVLRKCVICGLEAKTQEDLELFTLNANYKNKRQNVCKKCLNERNQKRRGERPFHSLYLTKKCECKNKKIPFDLTDKYLEELWYKQNGLCALSNLEMGMPYNRGDFDWCASLDRVDFSKGYIKGNIRWILNCINTLKRQKDDAFVIKIAEAITKHQFSRESQKP